MEKKVKIPDGVDIRIDGMSIAVKGPLGELSKDFDDPRFSKLVKVEKAGDEVHVSNLKEGRKIGAMVGTIAAHIKNMMLGTSIGFKYEMKVMYTHFPITVTHSGQEVQIKNFFGEKGSRSATVVGKTEVEIDKENITLTGINVEEVGQTAANLERACKLTGRDRRIFQDGIFLTGRRLKTGEKV
ncbi:MAG: 50S ribosomal protein L6 [Candidatus Aenigmarchaeota archaeon]|nr:50S ribosomal protein L6P [uncultured archaeon]MBS3050624.1 50S ribosomal protein L6 [Candidatus Aenigmarchaeota archaeon]